MRTAFLKTLVEMARKEPRVHFLVGDLGFNVVEPFANEFPDRFLNVGVAEQNMAGIAAGMALCGKIVFTYSIGNFPTLRCVEQIRNDVCYHGANVKIVSVGGGLAYGSLGVTHHATEDLAIMRALPGMTVVAPGDPIEAGLATEAVVRHDGPCYLRLGKAGEPDLHSGRPDFKLGRALTLLDGRDITLIATGGMLNTAVGVAHELAGKGLSARVLSMHTVKPLDFEAVARAARETGHLYTLEEHSAVGGLGSAVAEAMVDQRLTTPLSRIAMTQPFCKEAGSQSYLQDKNGLSLTAVLSRIQASLVTPVQTA